MSVLQDLFVASPDPGRPNNPFLRPPLAEKSINVTPQVHHAPFKCHKQEESPCMVNNNNAMKRPRSLASSLFPPPSLMSPAASLAADMGQNFHIDGSTPVVPTPRRSLFPAATPEDTQTLKENFYDIRTFHQQGMRSGNSLSRSSLHLSNASSVTSISSIPETEAHDHSRTLSNAPDPGKGHRKKSLSNASFLLKNKPSLSWSLSGESDFSGSSSRTSSLSLASTSSQFRSSLKSAFTPKVSDTPTSEYDDMDIDSYFQQSPMASRMTSARESFDSPATTKVACPLKVRRIHSMFQNPQEVVKEEVKEIPESITRSVSDASPLSSLNANSQSLLNRPDCGIKTFTVKEDPFHRIERHTLCEIIDGKYNHLYDNILIIDCRFEYEYEGGHIEGAVNINTKQDLEARLLKDRNNGKSLLVFHCEYSAHRGPRMAMHLRNCDRHLNMAQYPKLHYPDIAILHGGYSHFFELFHRRCVPQRYVEMNDSSHRRTCEREMDRFRKNMKFSRTQSYTFGSYKPSNFDIDEDSNSPFRFPGKDFNTTPTAPSNRTKLTRIHSEKLFA